MYFFFGGWGGGGMEITDLLGLILEMSMHNFIEMFLE